MTQIFDLLDIKMPLLNHFILLVIIQNVRVMAKIVLMRSELP